MFRCCPIKKKKKKEEDTEFIMVAPSLQILNVQGTFLGPFRSCFGKTWFKFLVIHRQNVDQTDTPVFVYRKTRFFFVKSHYGR